MERGEAKKHDDWEEEVEKWLEERFNADSSRFESDELRDATKAQARSSLLMGGRSGKEVTLEQIQVHFAARLKVAQLKAPADDLDLEELELLRVELDLSPEEYERYKNPPPPWDLELLQQAVYLDLPLGRKAAITWFRDTRLTVRQLIMGEQIMANFHEANYERDRDLRLPGNTLQRHFTAMGNAMNLLNNL